MKSWRNRVVFDVETIGCHWEDFSDEERAYLIRKAEGNEAAAQGKLALSPLTGELVLIGTLNPDTRRGKIHYVRPYPVSIVDEVPRVLTTSAADGDTFRAEVQLKGWPDESALLRAFWEDVSRDVSCYDQVISFNGRAFDGPMVMVRSMALGVAIRRDLVPNRYHDDHLDLADRLTGYGAMRDRYSLDFWCRRLGIPSPKEGGVNGADVERLWRAGEIAKLCTYNAGDLRATAALFAKYAAAYGSVHSVHAVATPGAAPADGAPPPTSTRRDDAQDPHFE